MAQLEMGDCQPDKSVGLVDRFYPYRYRTGLSIEQLRLVHILYNIHLLGYVLMTFLHPTER